MDSAKLSIQTPLARTGPHKAAAQYVQAHGAHMQGPSSPDPAKVLGAWIDLQEAVVLPNRKHQHIFWEHAYQSRHHMQGGKKKKMEAKNKNSRKQDFLKTG